MKNTQAVEAAAMIFGGCYNWINQPERLVYVGKKGSWHQFKKIGDPREVWCELLDSDLHMIEETLPEAALRAELSKEVVAPVGEPKLNWRELVGWWEKEPKEWDDLKTIVIKMFAASRSGLAAGGEVEALIWLKAELTARKGQLEKLAGTGQSYHMLTKEEVLDYIDEAIHRAATRSPVAARSEPFGYLDQYGVFFKAKVPGLALTTLYTTPPKPSAQELAAGAFYPQVTGYATQPPKDAAPVAGDTWLPMETAPTDSTMVRLLVDYTGEDAFTALEDAKVAQTIGFNSDLQTGDPVGWQFAGWDWQQDCFCQGFGRPIGWLPFTMPATPAGVQPSLVGGENSFHLGSGASGNVQAQGPTDVERMNFLSQRGLLVVCSDDENNSWTVELLCGTDNDGEQIVQSFEAVALRMAVDAAILASKADSSGRAG